MYRETVEILCEAALHPARTVRESEEKTGKGLVGCFPMHTPEEIVYAAGMIPVGMWGGKTEIINADKYLQGFCCSVMRSNIEFAMRGLYDRLKAVIIPTACDTLKCIVENWKVAAPQIPVIGMAYAQNRKITAGRRYMVSEFMRVKSELEIILGKIIPETDIEEAFLIYEEYRKTMREFCEEVAKHPEKISAKERQLIIKAGQFMDKAVYTEMVKEIVEGLRLEKESNFKGTKVIVTGLMAEPIEILDIFDKLGVAIVGDDLSQGSRIWRTEPDANETDVYMKMASIVANAEGDTFLYEPEKLRGQKLIEMKEKTGADGIIVMIMKFCDPEEYDYPIYKAELEEANIPELYLEVDQHMTSFEQFRTRIESFLEMLM